MNNLNSRIARWIGLVIIVTVALGCGGGNNNSSPPSAITPPITVDTIPNQFSFVGQHNVEFNTIINSDIIVVTGFNSATAISIVGGEYSINGGEFTSVAGTISSEQSVTVQGLSAETMETTTSVVLNIGGIEATFTLTTPLATNATLLLNNLGAICTNAGGSWENLSCQCDTTDNGFMAFSSISESCNTATSVSVVPDCLETGTTYTNILEAEGAEAFATCLGNGVARNGFSSRLSIQNAPESSYLELAAWLDTYMATSKLNTLLPSETNTGLENRFTQELILQFSFPNPEDFSTTSQYLAHPMPGASFATVYNTVFIDDVASLDGILGLSSEMTIGQAVPEALQVLVKANEQTPFNQANNYQENAISEKCIRACYVDAYFNIEIEGVAYSINRQRRYHGGVVFDERLMLMSSSRKQLFGWIHFAPNGTPNFWAALNYNTDAFTTTVTTFRHDYQEIGHAVFNALELGEVDKVRPFVEQSTSLAVNDLAVVVCESGFGGGLDNITAEALFTGPYYGLAGDQSKSLFGWRRADANNVTAYLDGVVETFFSIPNEDNFTAAHAGEITRLVLGMDLQALPWPGIRFIPMSPSTCIRETEVMEELAANDVSKQVRIVNFSAVLPIDHAACTALMNEGLSEHFLWVVASGNSSRAFLDLASSQGCPQSSPYRDNLIVVNGNDPFDLSDKGAYFADIGANMSYEGAYGTSNSSPRVAHVAARIALVHGSAISNAMIRTAILLSAKIPDDIPLNNRTGGALNLFDALLVADTIVNNNWGDLQYLNETQASDILVALYANEIYQDIPLDEFKLQTLQSNDFFKH